MLTNETVLNSVFRVRDRNLELESIRKSECPSRFTACQSDFGHFLEMFHAG